MPNFRISALSNVKNLEAMGTVELAGQPDDGSRKPNCESNNAQIGPHLLEPRRGCAVRGISLSGSAAEAFFRSQLIAF